MKEAMISFIFTVMVVTILKFLSPSEKYGKYINLFASMIILSSIVSPLFNLITSHSFEEILGANTFYFDSVFANNEYNISSKNNNHIIISEFEKTLSSHIEDILYQKFSKKFSVKIDVNENDEQIDYSSINFIEITPLEKNNISKQEIITYLNEVYLFDKKNIYLKE